MYGLISPTHAAVSAVLLQGVSLCTLVPKALRYERWTRCHQSHLASPNTARDLHAAHVHAALRGAGKCDSLSDTRHVCAPRECMASSVPCTSLSLLSLAVLLQSVSRAPSKPYGMKGGQDATEVTLQVHTPHTTCRWRICMKQSMV